MILITGGAGYIGSHISHQLIESGSQLVCLDNFYSGHRWAVPSQATLIEGNAGDQELVRKIIKEHKITTVVHCAGHIVVPESITSPIKYYENNTAVSLRLISTCIEEGVENFVFSSTASVYGDSSREPISESTLPAPINPYGSSKLMIEWILRDVANSLKEKTPKREKAFRYIALRYFNVAGARLDGKLGQSTQDATHLIKIACQAALGLREKLEVYGTDYPTPDGTCVRDYIHVEDLANAHLLAVQYLEGGGCSQIFNCGYGHGYTVKEILSAVKKVSGLDFKIVETGRRPGDSAQLIANSSKLKSVLGWKPKFDDIDLICKTAFEWEKKSI